MHGTWSMVFRGRRTDMEKLLAGLERIREDPAYEAWEAFAKPLRKALKSLTRLPWTGKKLLRVDGNWKNAIIGLSGAMEAFHRFAPRTEAACRTGITAYYYIDYLAPKAEKALFTEMKRTGTEEYEGESEGIEYEEFDLPGEQGEMRGWKVERGYRHVLCLWEDW